MIVRIPVSSLEKVAAARPAGYLPDVLSRGRVVDGRLEIPRKEYDRLVLKYRPGGPGTELKAALAWLGFSSRPGCACNKRASYMDKMGCDWCEQNIGQIVGWLKEEHDRQRSIVPFIPSAVEQVVRFAIRRARKKGNSQ